MEQYLVTITATETILTSADNELDAKANVLEIANQDYEQADDIEVIQIRKLD